MGAAGGAARRPILAALNILEGPEVALVALLFVAWARPAVVGRWPAGSRRSNAVPCWQHPTAAADADAGAAADVVVVVVAADVAPSSVRTAAAAAVEIG